MRAWTNAGSAVKSLSQLRRPVHGSDGFIETRMCLNLATRAEFRRALEFRPTVAPYSPR